MYSINHKHYLVDPGSWGEFTFVGLLTFLLLIAEKQFRNLELHKGNFTLSYFWRQTYKIGEIYARGNIRENQELNLNYSIINYFSLYRIFKKWLISPENFPNFNFISRWISTKKGRIQMFTQWWFFIF
jgi:hypothetical protein